MKVDVEGVEAWKEDGGSRRWMWRDEGRWRLKEEDDGRRRWPDWAAASFHEAAGQRDTSSNY